MWQQVNHAAYEVWAWLRHEVFMHPFVFLAAVIVIISAVVMYRAEIRSK